MAFHDDMDYLLVGIEKKASPSTFDGPISPIWNVQKQGDVTVLVRSEDPFAELKDAVDLHKQEEVQIEQDLVDQAAEILELQQMLEEPTCTLAQKTASCWSAQADDPMLPANIAVDCITAPIRDRMDDMADRINQHLKEQEELKRMVDDKADNTVSLIDRFRGREAAKTGAGAFPMSVMPKRDQETIDVPGLSENEEAKAEQPAHKPKVRSMYAEPRVFASVASRPSAETERFEKLTDQEIALMSGDDMLHLLAHLDPNGEWAYLKVVEQPNDPEHEVDAEELREALLEMKHRDDPENGVGKMAARSKERPHGLPQEERDYCEDFMLDKLPTKGQEVWTPSGLGKVTDVGDRAVEVELVDGETRMLEFNRLRLPKAKKASINDELFGLFDEGERPTPGEFAVSENRGIMAAKEVR